MKLEELIRLAIERFEKLTTNTHRIGSHSDDWGGSSDSICFCEIKQQFKTELQTIVKESFKNTRVEEITSTPQGRDERDAYNEALKNIKDTQNQFLNN